MLRSCARRLGSTALIEFLAQSEQRESDSDHENDRQPIGEVERDDVLIHAANYSTKVILTTEKFYIAKNILKHLEDSVSVALF